MRRLPAVLLAAVTAVPVLTAAVSGTATASTATTPPATATATPTATTAAKPVATKLREVALTGVDPAALSRLTAQSVAPGTRGAPGATARMETSTPAVLTKDITTADYQTLGVTWAATKVTPDLLISVRTRSASGWTGWEPMDDDAGDDPTATSTAGSTVRGGTDPLWVGPSNGVQVRIVVRSGQLPTGLKLELIDPGTSGHDALATASTSPTTSVAAAGTVSAASPSTPAILSRAQWGADESKVRDTPTYMPTIRATVLHHTAGKNNYSKSQVPSIIRGDYAYHLSRGWDDIGYNALVDRFGQIWEGRAGGLTQAVMGAHAGGFNTDTFGIAMLGNYDVSRPTAASINAVARLMAWKLDLYHRNPLGKTKLTSSGGGTARYAAGRTVSLPVIMGHRDTGYTACPGRYLYPYLPSIRTKVRTLMKAALLDPTGAPASVLRGQAVSVSAGALVAQTWRLDVTAPFGGGRVARISGSAKAGARITATWNGKVTGGTLARPGRYTLTLTSSSAAGTARPVTDKVLVVPPAPAAEVPAVPSSGSGGYYPVTPTRLLDTRTGDKIGIGPGGRVDIPVLGQAGVPATGVSSVVLNLTASGVSDTTSLTVWPTGRASSRPVTGVPAGLTRSVLVTTRVGGNGSVSVGSSVGVTELTADVVGYFATGGSLVHPVASTRLYDSRPDPAGKLVADQPRLIPLPATLAGIPVAQITGLVLDVSVLSPTGPGTLTAYRPEDAGSLTSLTYRTGESIDNLAFVPVSGGSIAVRATGTPADAVLDVRAVLVQAPTAGVGPVLSPVDPAASTFTPVKPVLAVDTRTTGGAVKVGRPRTVVLTGSTTGVPATATAVVIDLTAIAPAATTWFQAYAGGQVSPGGTALRVTKGQTRGNLVVVPLGPGGTIEVANARGAAQMRIDVFGYLD